jgi:hypothetical protein
MLIGLVGREGVAGLGIGFELALFPAFFVDAAGFDFNFGFGFILCVACIIGGLRRTFLGAVDGAAGAGSSAGSWARSVRRRLAASCGAIMKSIQLA